VIDRRILFFKKGDKKVPLTKESAEFLMVRLPGFNRRNLTLLMKQFTLVDLSVVSMAG
jgi:hypothetical protein